MNDDNHDSSIRFDENNSINRLDVIPLLGADQATHFLNPDII